MTNSLYQNLTIDYNNLIYSLIKKFRIALRFKEVLATQCMVNKCNKNKLHTLKSLIGVMDQYSINQLQNYGVKLILKHLYAIY